MKDPTAPWEKPPSTNADAPRIKMPKLGKRLPDWEEDRSAVLGQTHTRGDLYPFCSRRLCLVKERLHNF